MSVNSHLHFKGGRLWLCVGGPEEPEAHGWAPVKTMGHPFKGRDRETPGSELGVGCVRKRHEASSHWGIESRNEDNDWGSLGAGLRGQSGHSLREREAVWVFQCRGGWTGIRGLRPQGAREELADSGTEEWSQHRATLTSAAISQVGTGWWQGQLWPLRH